MSIGQLSHPDDERSADLERVSASAGDLDVERDSDVPISTQIYWQLAYQIDSGRLLPGSRLAPVRELGAALRVNPNTIRAPFYAVRLMRLPGRRMTVPASSISSSAPSTAGTPRPA